MLVIVLTAGCVNPIAPSSSPSPSLAIVTTTTTAVTQNLTQLNLSAYLTDTMRAKNYTMVTPFTRSENTQTKTVSYNCTVRNAQGTYHVNYEVIPTTQAAQARYQQVKQTYSNQGYKMTQQNATASTGYSSKAAKNVGVSYVTSPLMRHCVVTVNDEKLIGNTPTQQAMWMQTWNTVNTHASTVGSTLPTATRTQMQTEMQEYMVTTASKAK